LHQQQHQRRGAEVPFAAAVAAAEREIALDATSGSGNTTLCQALRYATEARSARKSISPAQARETATWIERGLTACDAALALDMESAVTHGTRGALLLLKARREPPGTARQSMAAQAAQALRKALEFNRHLQRDYGPLLRAAQALAGADSQ
jgi:hypothetical protein